MARGKYASRQESTQARETAIAEARKLRADLDKARGALARERTERAEKEAKLVAQLGKLASAIATGESAELASARERAKVAEAKYADARREIGKELFAELYAPGRKGGMTESELQEFFKLKSAEALEADGEYNNRQARRTTPRRANRLRGLAEQAEAHGMHLTGESNVRKVW